MRCKALKPTSDSRLQDFLGTLQSFEAYLRFQPALIFPLAASRQLRRALTIRYRDSSVDSNIPELASIKAFPVIQNPFSRDRDRANVASIIIRFYIAILLSIPAQGKGYRIYSLLVPGILESRMSQKTASVLGNSYRHFLGRIPRVKINFCLFSLFRRFRRNCPRRTPSFPLGNGLCK